MTGSTCFLWHLHYHTDTLWMVFVSLSTRCYSSLRRHWARMELLLGMNLPSQKSLTKSVHRAGEEPARQLCSCCLLRLVWWVHLKNAALKHTGGQIFNHGKSQHNNCIGCNGSHDCSLSWIGLKKHILCLVLLYSIMKTLVIVSYYKGWVKTEWLMNAGFTLRQDKSIYSIVLYKLGSVVLHGRFTWTHNKLLWKTKRKHRVKRPHGKPV